MTITNANGLQINVKNGKLIIEVSVDKEAREKAPLSNSGKTKLVATTRGFMAIGDGLGISLNVTSAVPAAEK